MTKLLKLFEKTDVRLSQSPSSNSIYFSASYCSSRTIKHTDIATFKNHRNVEQELKTFARHAVFRFQAFSVSKHSFCYSNLSIFQVHTIVYFFKSQQLFVWSQTTPQAIRSLFAQITSLFSGHVE